MAIEYLNPEDRYDIEVFNRNFKTVEDAVNRAELMQIHAWNSEEEGVISITAYDWDGALLGNFAFVKASDPETQAANAQRAIDAFVSSAEIKAKLQSHAGYDFLAWVKDEKDIPTSYGTRVESNANATLTTLDIAEDAIMDFSTLVESTTVKAAYITNDEIELGEGTQASAMAARQYKVSVEKYNRAGTGSGWTVTFKIERGNVPRLTEGVARVQMNVQTVISETSSVSSYIYSLIPLKGSDVEFIDVLLISNFRSYTLNDVTNYMVEGARYFDLYITDCYKAQNPIGAARRNEGIVYIASFTRQTMPTYVGSETQNTYNVWDDKTYTRYGLIQSFYDHLISLEKGGSMAGSITAANTRYCGIVPSVSNNANLRNQSLERWIALGRPNFAYPTYDYATAYYIFSGEVYNGAETTNNGSV